MTVDDDRRDPASIERTYGPRKLLSPPSIVISVSRSVDESVSERLTFGQRGRFVRVCLLNVSAELTQR